MKKIIITTFAVAMLFGSITPIVNVVQAETIQQERESRITMLRQLLVLLQEQLQFLIAERQGSTTEVFEHTSSVKKLPVELISDVNFNDQGSGAFANISIKGLASNKDIFRWDYELNCEGNLFISAKDDTNLCGYKQTLYESGFFDSEEDLLILTLPIQNQSEKKGAGLTIKVSAFDASGNKIGYDDVILKFNKQYDNNYEDSGFDVYPLEKIERIDAVFSHENRMNNIIDAGNKISILGNFSGKKNDYTVEFFSREYSRIVSVEVDQEVIVARVPKDLPDGGLTVVVHNNKTGLSTDQLYVQTGVYKVSVDLKDKGSEQVEGGNVVRKYEVVMSPVKNNLNIDSLEITFKCSVEIKDLRIKGGGECGETYRIKTANPESNDATRFDLGVEVDSGYRGQVELDVRGYSQGVETARAVKLSISPAKG